MPRRQSAARLFEKIATEFAVKSAGQIHSPKFMPKLSEEPLIQSIFGRARLDPSYPGDWQLIALFAFAALNLKKVGRKKTWIRPALEELVELAAGIYREMPQATEATVSEIIVQTLQAMYGPRAALPKKGSFQRRLQEAKRAVHGAGFKLNVARVEGRRRQSELQVEPGPSA